MIHSLDPHTGGVCSAVELLNDAMVRAGIQSRISDDPKVEVSNRREWIIAHGLWQWPGRVARSFGESLSGLPSWYADPWFKKTYPFKHFKKQLYWWAIQGKILRDAHAVCFTTREERFWHKDFFLVPSKRRVTAWGYKPLRMNSIFQRRNSWKNSRYSRGVKFYCTLEGFTRKREWMN